MLALCVLSLAVLLFVYTLFSSCLLQLVTGPIMQSLLLCLSTERHLSKSLAIAITRKISFVSHYELALQL